MLTLLHPKKKKKDAKPLLIYSQEDKLDIVRGATVSAHFSRWSDCHRYDKHQICNRLLRAAQCYVLAVQATLQSRINHESRPTWGHRDFWVDLIQPRGLATQGIFFQPWS